ncbi:Tyrosine-protein kinase CSK [Taenia crassiceps]|uniref:Tyrosine-protein kinase CSK n=1 Tax=Taenia crassiceps TaxID=6207 RepID=A0ABR4Q5N9_9CEST
MWESRLQSSQADRTLQPFLLLVDSATSKYCADVLSRDVQQSTGNAQGPETVAEEATKSIAGNVDLYGIWTPAYYGDEEDFVEMKKDASENWVLFSTRDGRLLLKKGPHGKSYSIDGQYEVHIDNHVVRGKLLSELIWNVQSEIHCGEVANQRKCASTIYFKDLKHLAGFKEIPPFADKECGETAGMGDFGKVTLTNYTERVNDQTTSRQVAVKRIKQTSKNALFGAMEVAVMCALLEDSTINKQHLLALIGWYLDDEYLYVVTEFMPGGALLDYLQSLKLGKEEKDHIQHLEMHRFVSEITSGMCALEAKRIQHRDLAARNILLTQHRQIKIGDFGLSRPDGSTFTCGRISTRWTAPEVLENEANFTLRSDVWSFGVVMWEVYSLGSLPYSEVPSAELLTHLHSGRRLDAPRSTPSRMASLMSQCWQLQPASRPSFVDIDHYLRGLFVHSDSDAMATNPPPLPAKP